MVGPVILSMDDDGADGEMVNSGRHFHRNLLAVTMDNALVQLLLDAAIAFDILANARDTEHLPEDAARYRTRARDTRYRVQWVRKLDSERRFNGAHQGQNWMFDQLALPMDENGEPIESRP